jgi:signal transduction histidine kinase
VVVAQLDRMLQRVIGEDYRLEVRAGGGLGRVLADVAELEQLVLNLVLNARDAMPRGGLLTIETRDVEIAGVADPPAPPGRYVMVAVSDEGVGMDEETRKRIFDPFFSTKRSARSGLARRRARIVEHYGGRIRVDSARSWHDVPGLPALPGRVRRGLTRPRARRPGRPRPHGPFGPWRTPSEIG